MYQDKRLNATIMAASVLIGLVFSLSIRRQATISDPEIKTLCQTIIFNQQQKIDQMRLS